MKAKIIYSFVGVLINTASSLSLLLHCLFTMNESSSSQKTRPKPHDLSHTILIETPASFTIIFLIMHLYKFVQTFVVNLSL